MTQRLLNACGRAPVSRRGNFLCVSQSSILLITILKQNFVTFVLQKYMLYLLEDLYNKLGFDQGPNDDQMTIYKRVEVNTRACMLGLPDCVTRALAKFWDWITYPSTDM